MDLLNSGPNEDIIYEIESALDRDMEDVHEDDLQGQPWDDEVIEATCAKANA
jgi:hypothetical protein